MLKTQEATFACQTEFRKPPFMDFINDKVKVAHDTADRLSRPRTAPANHIGSVMASFDLFYWHMAQDQNSLKTVMVENINAIDIKGDKVLALDSALDTAWYKAFKALAEAFYELIIEFKEY